MLLLEKELSRYPPLTMTGSYLVGRHESENPGVPPPK